MAGDGWTSAVAVLVHDVLVLVRPVLAFFAGSTRNSTTAKFDHFENALNAASGCGTRYLFHAP